MKLYFRNILNNFKKNPFQPLLIFLTLVFSTAVFMASSMIGDIFYSFQYQGRKEIFNETDIVINDSDEYKLIFDYEMQEAIPSDKADYYGFFAFPIRFDGHLTDCIVIDFDDMLKYNPPKIVRQNQFSYNELNEVIIVSESYADQKGIKLGDDITISILGNDMTYTIIAIAEDSGFFSKYNFALNMKGVIRRLRSAYDFHLIKDTTQIFSTVMVVAHDGVDVSELLNIINGNLGDKYDVGLVYDEKYFDANLYAMRLVSIIFSVFSILGAGIVIFSVFKIYISKRMHSIAIFRSIGASKNLLNVLLIFECLIYGLLALIPGEMLGVLFIRYIAKTLSFPYAFELKYIFITWALNILCVLISSVPTVLLSTNKSSPVLDAKSDIKDNSKHSNIIAAICLAASVFVSIGFVVCDVSMYMYFSLIECILIFVFFFMVTPQLMNLLSDISAKITSKKDKQPVIYLGLKSLKKDDAGKNLVRIISFSCLILTSIIMILSSVTKTYDMQTSFFNADCIVKSCILSEDAVINDINETEGVERVESFAFEFQGLIIDFEGSNYVAYNGDYNNLFNLEGTGYVYNGPLKDNEIIITDVTAISLRKDVGDMIELQINDKRREFVIAQVIDFNTKIVFVNPDYVEAEPNMIFVFTEEGKSEAVIDVLSEKLGQKFCVVADQDYFITYEQGYTALLIGKYYVIFMSVLITISVINIIIDGLRNKKHDFGVLYSIGYDKKDIAKMISFKMIVATIVCIIFAVIMLFIILQFVFLCGLSVDVGLDLL